MVELIMAMAFFSFMMVILSIGVIQVMRIYQNNLSTRRTQQAARTIVEDVAREVRGAARIPVANIATQRLCLEGAQTVEYERSGTQLLKKVLQGSCSNSAVQTSQVLAGSADIQVRQFDPIQITGNEAGSAGSVQFTITITTGTDDLLDNNTCQPESGAEYCSATTYVSTVSMRGGEQ